MLEYTSIYGYIKIDRDYAGAVHYIKGLGKDENYPFINTNMFSFGDCKYPYYYENVMFGFAATYKYFGADLEDWDAFILKFENILKQIDFENAQLHVESAYGDLTLFWTRQGEYPGGHEREAEFLEEYRLIKTDDWYFGFGKRHPFTGYPDESIIPTYNFLEFWPEFKYPIPR